MAEIKKEEFRNYDQAPQSVKEFYRLNHINQTYDYVMETKAKVYPLRKTKLKFSDLHKIIESTFDDNKIAKI